MNFEGHELLTLPDFPSSPTYPIVSLLSLFLCQVCKNGSFHLQGNVYVQYKFLDSALLAYNSVNGRYFAGIQEMHSLFVLDEYLECCT